MAIRYAIASGNWSNPAIWDGGVAVPATTDEARTNGFTVTVDVSVTVVTVSNKSESSPVVASGGSFDLANGVTLTLTHATGGVIPGNASIQVVRMMLASPNAATVIGAFGGSSSVANSHAFLVGGSGTLNIIGNIAASPTSTGCKGVVFGAAGTLNVTGTVSGANAQAIDTTSGGAFTVNVTGNVTGGGGSEAIAANSTAAGVVNITGTVTGGSSRPGVALANSSVTVRIYGSCVASSASPAVTCYSTSLLFNLYVSGPIIPHSNGTWGVGAARAMWAPVLSATYMGIRTADLASTRNMYTADYATAFDQPAVGNVRSGTTYGIGGALTGTLAVPPPGAVGLGVPTDNTVGSAVWTQEALAAALAPVVAAYGS